MPRANSPTVAKAKIPVPKALKPTTRVLTAAAMRWAVKLSDASGLLAKAWAIDAVRLYRTLGMPPETIAPPRQRHGLGVVGGGGVGLVMGNGEKGNGEWGTGAQVF